MISVIAGVNGAGKSSILGSHLRRDRGEYFNPDEVARSLMVRERDLPFAQASARAWSIGYEQLARAIDEGRDYTLETTLGGHSICQLLHDAIDRGEQVRIIFIGLASPELHIARVGARVRRGGHAIPEVKIRERWVSAVHNLMGLIPRCAAVRVLDNSNEDDGSGPRPVCLFALQGDRFDSPPADAMPDWARPLASVAMKRALGESAD